MSTQRAVRAFATTVVHCDRVEVFRWLTDPQLVPRWVKGLVESRPLDGARLAPGARSVEVIRSGGRTLEMGAEIVEYSPGRVVANRLDTPDGPWVSRFEVEDHATSCRVSQSMSGEIAVPRLLPSGAVTWRVRSRIQGDLARLKRLAELGRRD